MSRIPLLMLASGIVVAALFGGEAGALGQAEPTCPPAPGCNPTLKASPSSARRAHGVANVTFSGRGWSWNLVCDPKITLSATDATGDTTRLPSVRVKETARSFSKRYSLKLARGAYTVTATRSCDTEEGGDLQPGTASTQLTIK
jgi:hypothetical protein